MQEKQIDYLYDTLDPTFRGFRHGGGKADGSISTQDAFRNKKEDRSKLKPVNWENTLNRDADAARFSNQNNGSANNNKTIDSYYSYLKKKEDRNVKNKINREIIKNYTKTTRKFSTLVS